MYTYSCRNWLFNQLWNKDRIFERSADDIGQYKNLQKIEQTNELPINLEF